MSRHTSLPGSALSGEASPPPRALPKAATALLAATTLAFIVWISWQRGPWLDEFWTLWISRHDVKLSEAIRQRWLIDVHPPLFAFLSWAIQPVFGDSLLPRRLLNLLPLGLLVGTAILLSRRYRDTRAFATVFMALAVTAPVFIHNASEIRSYFTQICAFSALILALSAICSLGTEEAPRRNLPLAAGTVVLIFVSLNLHYVTAVTGACMVAAVGAGLLLTRRSSWFWLLAVAGFCASVPLVGWFYAQTTSLDKMSGTFWVSVSFQAALRTLAAQILKSFGFNLVAVATIALAAVAFLRGDGRSVPVSSRSRDTGSAAATGRSVFIVAMVAGLALGSAILLVVNVKHPHLFVPRYLSTVALMTLAIVAALIAPVLSRKPILYVLLVANGLIVAGVVSFARAHDEGWDRAATLIDAQWKRCGAAQVYALEFPAKYLVINQTDVIHWAYRLEAGRFGFPVRVVDSVAGVAPRGDGACPTLLWIDHVDWSELPQPVTREALAAELGAGAAGVLASATLINTGTGLLVVDGPPAPGR